MSQEASVRGAPAWIARTGDRIRTVLKKLAPLRSKLWDRVERLGTRLRYRIDVMLSKGVHWIILWLSVVAALLTTAAAIVLWLVEAGSDSGFLGVVWLSLMHIIDSGTVTEQTGGWLARLTMLFTTVAGIFLLSTVIGVITSSIMRHIETLARGRSKVVESGHTVIFGWSNEIFTVLEELTAAYQDRGKHCIVVIADRDKTEMEEQIATKVSRSKAVRIVCRSGSPMDFSALEVVNLNAAKSAIVVAPDNVDDPDIHVIKTLLAVVNNPQRRDRNQPYHIVTEIRSDENFAVAKEIGKDEVVVEPVRRTISRLITQRARHPGLTLVHNELLSFKRNEFYFWPDVHDARLTTPNPLAGNRYGDLLHAFDRCVIAGIYRQTEDRPARVMFNPAMDTVIEESDELILVAESEQTIGTPSLERPDICTDAIANQRHEPQQAERLLILGWNWRAESVIGEWAKFVEPGSELLVLADWTDEELAHAQARFSEPDKVTVTFQRGTIIDPATLRGVNVESFDHVILLSYSDRFGTQEADAYTLITLVHLRTIAKEHSYPFSIATEMLDIHNRDLAHADRADDFIVSYQTMGRMLAQVSEQPAARTLFNELLASRGADIHLNPAADYIVPGRAVTFSTVLEAARQLNESAIGYRIDARSQDADSNYGIVLNPDKHAMLDFVEDDRIIVLASNQQAA